MDTGGKLREMERSVSEDLMAAMSASQLATLALTRILHSDSLNKMMMTMNLPKPRPQLQALQAKLDSLKKSSRSSSSKTKPKNLQPDVGDLEEDVFSSDDFFSEE